MRNLVSVKWLQENYRKIEEMVPMRDGIRLYTAVYEPYNPESGKAARPVIMIRTPFPLNPYGKSFTKDLRGYMELFAKNGYIIVYQNVRGRFMSEGEFENVRPLVKREARANPFVTDEASDTYDTVEWLLKNFNTNGKIGVKGMSYPGFYATIAALSDHPAIKAVSPQAPVTDWFMGDDAHLGGILQLPIYSFGASFFRPRKGLTNRWPKPVAEPKGDLYDYFLEKGPDILEPLKESLPFFKDILEHPTYDEFWKSRCPLNHLDGKLPAMLLVGGWFDAEDAYGPFETYRRVKEQSPETDLYLCAAPWYHGAWKKRGYESLGELHFTPGSAEYFREEVEYPFFAKYLEEKGSGPVSKVSILPSGETSSNLNTEKEKVIRPGWQHYGQWPPAGEEKKLYLNFEGSLEKNPPLENGYSGYKLISDPKHPVPYNDGILEYFTREAYVADQRFASRRIDVLTFSTEKLKEPLRIEGRVKVVLYLRCGQPRTDMDIIVKLIDLRPDGYHLPLRIGARPVRFRDSFSEPSLPGANDSIRMEIELTDIAHQLMPGHKLMLHIQGTIFPLLALPKWENIQEVFVQTGRDNPSCIILPVCKNL